MSELADEESSTQATIDVLERHYGATLRLVASLPELSMRANALGRSLKELEAGEAVWFIDQLIRGALWGDEAAMDAMLACSRFLIQSRIEDDYDLLQRLFEAAHTAERRAVILLVRDVPAQSALPKGRRLPEVRLPMERDVTMGERRTLAGGSNRKYLERLLMDPEPLVLAKLLDNPNIRLADLIVVGARRPTTPELLRELVIHEQWFKRQELREAVALNPFNATGVSLKLLVTLHIRSLRMIAHAGDLHPMVSESAKQLVELREERTAPWRV
ncbi:MAG: hypothetical protein H0U74_12870 [Bradymonadaceae bacterium]|nr:hypothetical protein [Lujinxingiaceae bacterium]